MRRISTASIVVALQCLAIAVLILILMMNNSVTIRMTRYTKDDYHNYITEDDIGLEEMTLGSEMTHGESESLLEYDIASNTASEKHVNGTKITKSNPQFITTDKRIATLTRPLTRFTKIDQKIPENNTQLTHVTNRTTNSSQRQDACDSCFTYPYHISAESKICDEGPGNEKVMFIILIFSRHNAIERRNAIRETWGSVSRGNTGSVRYGFLFGKNNINNTLNTMIMEENKVYGDILMSDFTDSYDNLTLKSIMAFKWTSSQCAHAQYLMKTDDDTWINMPRVLKLLPTLNSSEMVGMCAYYGTGPIRDKKFKKWYVPRDEYPKNYYPQYCAGSCYLTTMNVVHEVVKNFNNIPFFRMEDVYIGLVLNHLKIRRRHIPGFESYHMNYRPCRYNSDKMYTNHYMTPVLMRRAWGETCPLTTMKPTTTTTTVNAPTKEHVGR